MRRGVFRVAAVFGLATVLIAALTVPVSARTAKHKAAPAATPLSGNVIVVLKQPSTSLRAAGRSRSARAAVNHSSEAGALARARSRGDRNLHGFGVISAFKATVTASQAAALKSDPSVAAVYPDLTITGPAIRQDRAGTTGTASAGSPVTPAEICPSDPSRPLLEPEALQVTNTAFDDPSTPQAQNIVDGTGIKVAFLADGLDINNPDFIRADGSHVFIDYQDFSGDGTSAVSGAAEAFGDASAIAAQGRATYDLANFVNPAHPLPPGCNIHIRGVAPGASLIGLKVFGNSNTAPTSRFIEAIDYAINAGADVINESFGANPFPDNGDDPITLADNAAIAAGITVVSSTGDAGTTGTIGSPATDPQVIGVAGSTTFRSYAQRQYSGFQLGNGTWYDNAISGLSSGGISQLARVPDLVAPGDLGWALCTPDTSLYTECTNDAGVPSPIQDFGGTSQSSPLTAGAAALVIEAYENTHHGVRPAPVLVKRIITSTATDLGDAGFEQGAGLLNTLKAVQAAQSWQDGNGSPTPVGSALVLDQTQLSAVGIPGSTVHQKLQVTNVSGHNVTIHPSTRVLGSPTTIASGSDTLNTATASAYVDSFGIQRSFVTQTITVPSGADQLDVSVAASAAPFSIRVILLDPTGAYAAYSIPQGANNFGHVNVEAPVGGAWTAVFALSKSSGFNGSVHFAATTSNYTTVPGTVTPATLVLHPGQTRAVSVNAQLAAQPGDVSASVQLAVDGGDTTSVPLTERAVVPPGNTSFNGVITGGNGRGAPAQSNVYTLTVPPGQSDLGINVQLSDPNEVVIGVLTGPDGQVSSYQSNLDLGGNETAGLQLYKRDPMPGHYTFSMAVFNPVPGTEVSQPFAVNVQYGSVQVQATGLPDSTKTKLPAGTPVTVPVSVTNTSSRPLAYFADARLNTIGHYTPIELTGNSTMPLPEPAGVAPEWLLPSDSTDFSVVATADQPVNLDVFYTSGEPDVYGAAVASGASIDVAADQVSPGLWSADVGQTGPFAGPAPAGTVTVTASSQTQLFDPAVTSSTNDFWSTAGGSPLVLGPGATGTINVTITPNGPSRSVARGHLYITTLDGGTLSGDELVSLPYAYRIR